MSDDPRKLSIGDLPQPAEAALSDNDIQPVPDGGADIKGGGRYGIRAGVRVGVRAGIRANKLNSIRSLRNVKDISGSGGDLKL